MNPVRLTVAIMLSVCCTVSHAQTAIIAVASNLTDPMTEIAGRFRSETGMTVRISYGSSATFTRQIIQGAPYEIFVTAGKSYVDQLVQGGIIVQTGTEFVRGSIVLYIPPHSLLKDQVDLDSVINAMIYRGYRKISLPDPAFSPYGIAAFQALQSAGLWAIEKNRLLLAENVTQVLPYMVSGNADAAILPASFMKRGKLAAQGTFFPFPETWHDPIVQHSVLLNKAGALAKAFYNFLYGDYARKTLEQYGYEVIRPR